MALKVVIDALSDVDAALRSHYEQKDGKFHLAMQGEPPKLAEFRDRNIAQAQELTSMSH